MTRISPSLAALTLGALSLSTACGGDESPSPGNAGFTVDFGLSKGGDQLLACSDVSFVRAVQVRVLSADGTSPLLGWPKDADCATGKFVDTTLGEGTYTLEVVAKGDLFDDPSAVLFKLRRSFTLPADRAMSVSLAPEVAFLDVTWSFADPPDLATACADIDSLSLFLGTGAAGSGSYQKTNIDCTDGRFVVPTPLLPQSFTLQMDAFAKTTLQKVYNVTEQRLLERGQNPPFAAVFRPVGGQVLFDLRFLVGAATVMPCDDARVAVSSLVARITTDDGDEPIESPPIPCAGQRPVRFPGVRYTQGRMITLTVTAEGEQRFRLVKSAVTTPGDTDLGLLTIPAVGSATITITRTSSGSACGGPLDRLRVTATAMGARMPAFAANLDVTGGSTPVIDVPLGEYTLVVEGMRADFVACRAEGARSITGRSNRWDPLAL